MNKRVLGCELGAAGEAIFPGPHADGSKPDQLAFTGFGSQAVLGGPRPVRPLGRSTGRDTVLRRGPGGGRAVLAGDLVLVEVVIFTFGAGVCRWAAWPSRLRSQRMANNLGTALLTPRSLEALDAMAFPGAAGGDPPGGGRCGW